MGGVACFSRGGFGSCLGFLFSVWCLFLVRLGGCTLWLVA